MALADVVRSGIALANRLTDSFQVNIQHYAWIGDNEAGEPMYAATAQTLRALDEQKRSFIRTADSRELKETTVLTIIGPVAANGAAHRREPIDNRDKLVLPDGRSFPILNVDGLVDPSTGRPYMYQVYLG